MWLLWKGENKWKGANNANRRIKKLTFKNNAPSRSFITKINNTFIDDAENLHNAMPMYDLLESSDSYSMTSGSLRNCYRDEVKDDVNKNYNTSNYRINNNKTKTRTYFWI